MTKKSSERFMLKSYAEISQRRLPSEEKQRASVRNTLKSIKMLDINNKILIFSGFKTNQDLVQKTGVPQLYQITNGTASYYLPSITAAPIINNQLNCIYHENVKRDKRLLRTTYPEPMPKAGCKTIPRAMSRVQGREEEGCPANLKYNKILYTMKKLFICAAVVAASAFGVMKASDVNVKNDLSDLQLDNIEATAQTGEPYEYHYYELVCTKEWKGTAPGPDGNYHPAKFKQMECPEGLVLDNCYPHVEVLIYD